MESSIYLQFAQDTKSWLNFVENKLLTILMWIFNQLILTGGLKYFWYLADVELDNIEGLSESMTDFELAYSKYQFNNNLNQTLMASNTSSSLS